MAVCQICNKGPRFGNTVSHSKRHTRRMWEPNMKRRSVLLNGQPQRMYICTRCIRTRAKSAK